MVYYIFIFFLFLAFFVCFICFRGFRVLIFVVCIREKNEGEILGTGVGRLVERIGGQRNSSGYWISLFEVRTLRLFYSCFELCLFDIGAQ